MSGQIFGPEFNISSSSFACDLDFKNGNSSAFFMMNETSLSVPGNHGIMEWFAREIFYNVISVVIWFFFGIGIMGIIGNILTIVVFIKLGFSETIHMSYLALAVSDLCAIITTIWCGICYSPLIEILLNRFRIVTELNLFANFTCFWPHLAFSKTTALITAWISLERCLCVVFPIKVKLIITRSVTKIVLLVIFITGCGPVVFAYTGRKSEWRFDPMQNQTRFYMFKNAVKDLNLLNRLAFSLYSTVYPVFSWVSVIVCTTFLIIKLRQSASWRKRNVTAPSNDTIYRNQTQERGISVKANRITKTVVAVAIIFIVCSFPISISVFFSSLMREFSLSGRLRYLVSLNASIILVPSEINSSVNIIVFTVMGTRFRSTLFKILCRK
ncbi:chemosensory receptor a [Plakobranchus ocellatus]|uniref:Chemosensory receptor a n=1 Tax=Plakobranchus ocellatus TaxID=259542 RepID=A0AAV4A5E1_9GAST|nr:chemosensory receptor a [Plakobranchus ocellatus]